MNTYTLLQLLNRMMIGVWGALQTLRGSLVFLMRIRTHVFNMHWGRFIDERVLRQRCLQINIQSSRAFTSLTSTNISELEAHLFLSKENKSFGKKLAKFRVDFSDDDVFSKAFFCKIILLLFEIDNS